MIKLSLLLSLLGATIALSGCPKSTTVRLIDGKARPSRYVSPTAYEHYVRAELHRQKGAHREAIRELRAALIFDDEAPYLHARLADSLIALGELPRAESEIRRGLKLDSSHPDLLLVAARLATAQKRFHGAEQALRRCVTGAVLDERCHLRLATLLARQGRPTEARSVLVKLVTRTGSPAGLVAHSELCLAALDLSCAMQKLEKALIRQRSLSWLLQLARIQQAAGKWDLATKSWWEAFNRSDLSLHVALPLLTTLQLAHDNKGIDDLFRMLEQKIRARGEGGAILAELMVRVGRPTQALAWLAQIKHPKNKEQLMRARALAALGRGAEAHKILHGLLKGPLGAEAALEKARLYERKGQRREALSLLSRAHEAKGDARSLGRERARLLIDSGQIEAGLAIVRRAATSSKNQPEAKLALAATLLRAGRWSQAIKVAETVLEKDPDHVPALNFVGYTLVSHGQSMDRARQLLERAHRLHPLKAYIIDSMGFWQLRTNHPRYAATLLDIAHRLDPFASEIAAHLAEARFALGEKAAALTLIRHAMAHTDDARLAARLRTRLSQWEGMRARKSGP